MQQKEKVTLLTLKKMKEREQPAVFITAYDFPLGRIADRAGADMILVGDSVGMTTLGYETTIPVTMEDMIRHSQAVTRGAKRSFVVGDMPFMSYQSSDRDAVLNAGRFIAEAHCDAVKLEGGKRVAPRIRAIVDAGIVCMGHLGLTPQNASQMGGYRVQGKNLDSYKELLDDAIAVQEAGADLLLLEAIPSPVAGLVAKHLTIPVYGIGAGNRLDGQLVIIHDIIGLFEEFTPKFVKRFCEAGKLIEDAVGSYCDEVRAGVFPGENQMYPIKSAAMEEIIEYEKQRDQIDEAASRVSQARSGKKETNGIDH